jgi:hypothetical protein
MIRSAWWLHHYTKIALNAGITIRRPFRAFYEKTSIRPARDGIVEVIKLRSGLDEP